MSKKRPAPPVPPPPPELHLPRAERVHVDPHTVAPSKYLMRDTINEDEFDRLIESVRNVGFAGAATGMRRADGSIVLTSGKRLWLVAKHLGRDLPLDVRPEGTLVAIVQALVAHTHDVPLSAFEEGRLYREAIRDMTRILGHTVTQKMLAHWLGISEALVSQCLCIVRNLTPEIAKEAGVEFSALKNRPQRRLYSVAKIADRQTRKAHLVHLVTGSWPPGCEPERKEADRPYTRRDYGLRVTYSIPDKTQITDAEMDELVATMRADVVAARAAAA